MITNNTGLPIAIIPEEVTKEDKALMQLAPQAVTLILSFVDNVNKGNHKPRTQVKAFEQFLEKFNELSL